MRGSRGLLRFDADVDAQSLARQASTVLSGSRTVRRECIDRILIVNRRHLERVLRVYICHYNEHRPHRSLDQRPPIEEPQPGSNTVVVVDHVRRRDLLGGVVHEYKTAV